jgi:hypothetical protein
VNFGRYQLIIVPIYYFREIQKGANHGYLYLSMTVRTSGFRKWSEAHDPKIAVRAVASEAAVISAPDLDQGLMTPAEQPHRPWLVPGAGTL